MAKVDLSYIKKVFSEGFGGAGGDTEAFRELMLMILARATDADSYTHPAEVAAAQAVIKKHLNEELGAAEIRTVALSELYEEAPLEKYISRLGPSLSLEQRKTIISALAEVLRSDGRVAASEAIYFDMVAMALRMTYSEVAGLS